MKKGILALGMLAMGCAAEGLEPEAAGLEGYEPVRTAQFRVVGRGKAYRCSVADPFVYQGGAKADVLQRPVGLVEELGGQTDCVDVYWSRQEDGTTQMLATYDGDFWTGDVDDYQVTFDETDGLWVAHVTAKMKILIEDEEQKLGVRAEAQAESIQVRMIMVTEEPGDFVFATEDAS